MVAEVEFPSPGRVCVVADESWRSSNYPVRYDLDLTRTVWKSPSQPMSASAVLGGRFRDGRC